MLSRCVTAWLSSAALLATAAAAEEPVAAITIPKVSRPPLIEDFTSERPLPAAAVIRDFRQRDPGDGAAASEETAAYLSYDTRNLYVVFSCKDRTGLTRAHLGRREDIELDDQVVLYLDTFRDRQRAYVFAVNALGVQRDGILTEGQDDDYSFDTLWHSEARRTREGYAVRMAIPFRSLRFPAGARQSWGIALGRTIPGRSEDSYWPYITKRYEGFVPQMGTLDGIEGAASGRNLQFIPYAIAAGSRYLDRDSASFRRADDRRLGLDAKAVLHDHFTLDATLNPDFSQVESDEPQVTVNQRFEVFFPEKRPFFLENAGLFDTPVKVFFSRRIVDPRVGLRLTGKAGRWAIGALASDDRAAGQRLADSDPRHGDTGSAAVLRVQREFGRQSRAGLTATSRTLGGTFDRLLSVDTRLKLGDNWALSGQAMRSFTHGLDGAASAGNGFFAHLAHDGHHVEYVARYTDLAPSLRAPLGFVKRVDLRQTEHKLKYRWRRGHGLVVKYGPTLTALANWDHQGRLQDWSAGAGFKVELRRRTELEISRTEAMERFQGRDFRRHDVQAKVSGEWLDWLMVSGALARGTAIDFDPAPGLEPFLARSTEASLTLTLRPAASLRFDQTYLFSRLSTPPGFVASPTGGTVFENAIARWKASWQATRRLAVRVILDYEGVLPDERLSALEKTRRLSGDALVTYLINPGTAVHLGYTDRRENLDIDPVLPARLRRLEWPQTSTARQLFFKVSYLWRM